jgi:hypothetical protein
MPFMRIGSNGKEIKEYQKEFSQGDRNFLKECDSDAWVEKYEKELTALEFQTIANLFIFCQFEQ